MKLITLVVFVLVSFCSISQIKLTDPVISYYEDFELSKLAFKKFNDHRESIGAGSWKWSDSSYLTAKQWNNTMASQNLWGHSHINNSSSEIIVSVTLSGLEHPNGQDLTAPLDYEFIIDSCIAQILHSSYHRGGFCAPVKTETRKSANIEWGPITLSKLLCDAGAVSAYVVNYGHYLTVTMVIHTIQLPNKKPSK
jgi:hypothetical protein